MTGALERLAGPILVVGGYGYRNVGDEAILAGLLARLGDRTVTVVSRSPAETASLHGVRSIGIDRATVALAGHRTVLIGGGGLFGSDMGRIGRLLPVYGMLAIALGRRVVVEGVDLDHELPAFTRILAHRLLRQATRVSVRDRGSVEALARWGVRAHLAPDLSAWMPAAPPSLGRQLLQAAGVDTGRPVVGLALTAVRPELTEAVLAAVGDAMDALPHVQFCFLPLSRHPFVPDHDDLLLARKLQALRPRLRIVEELPHPAVVLSAFGHLSAAIAMRYHGMLFAERAATPLISIAYAEKNLRWLAEHGRSAVAPAEGPLVEALADALAADERMVGSMAGMAS